MGEKSKIKSARHLGDGLIDTEVRPFTVLLVDSPVKTLIFAFRDGDHEQSPPALIAFRLDAGLEGDVSLSEVNPFEHLLGGENFIPGKAAEGTVGAGGLQCLIVQDFRNNEGFHTAVTVHQTDLLTDFEL